MRYRSGRQPGQDVAEYGLVVATCAAVMIVAVASVSDALRAYLTGMQPALTMTSDLTPGPTAPPAPTATPAPTPVPTPTSPGKPKGKG